MNDRKENKQTEKPPVKNPFRRIFQWFLRKKEKFINAVHERTKDVKHAKAKRIAFFFGAGLFLLFFLLFYLTLGKMIAEFIKDADAFKEWMDGFNPFVAVAVYLLLRILQTVFKILPGGALEIAAGFIFGVWQGFLWSMVGSLIGSLLILLLGKKCGVKMVGLFVDPEKLHAHTEDGDKKKHGALFFLMYFLPWTPKDIFTWIASITEDKPLYFMIITSLARMPSVFVSAWCGAAIVSQKYVLALGILGAIVVLGVLGSIIYNALTKRRKNQLSPKGEREE